MGGGSQSATDVLFVRMLWDCRQSGSPWGGH